MRLTARIKSADAKVNAKTLRELEENLLQQRNKLKGSADRFRRVHSNRGRDIKEIAECLVILRERFMSLCTERIPLDHPLSDVGAKLMKEVNELYRELRIGDGSGVTRLVLPEPIDDRLRRRRRRTGSFL